MHGRDAGEAAAARAHRLTGAKGDIRLVLEESVVSARKRNEILEVPIAISVFTREALGNLGIKESRERSEAAPTPAPMARTDHLPWRSGGRPSTNGLAQALEEPLEVRHALAQLNDILA